MNVEQYVMAYSVEQDRLRAILPDGFTSLRPVLRINAEIIDDVSAYIEFNKAVEKGGNKGWLNIGYWNDVPWERNGKSVKFGTDFLEISFKGVGIEGSCPAEKDNGGCYFLEGTEALRKLENITVKKEFCDCNFSWKFTDNDAYGESIGETIPAYPTEIVKVYPKVEFTPENAAHIPCIQVLGAYMVKFVR